VAEAPAGALPGDNALGRTMDAPAGPVLNGSMAAPAARTAPAPKTTASARLGSERWPVRAREPALFPLRPLIPRG
jgi:hypothetical protein